MARTIRTDGESENAPQERSIFGRGGRVRFSIPPVLSASASGGASRSGKQFPCDSAGPLSLGISVGGDRVAGRGLQTERLAENNSDFPHRLLVSCTSNSSHAGSVGVVAILEARRRCFSSREPLTQVSANRRLTLYAGS